MTYIKIPIYIYNIYKCYSISSNIYLYVICHIYSNYKAINKGFLKNDI